MVKCHILLNDIKDGNFVESHIGHALKGDKEYREENQNRKREYKKEWKNNDKERKGMNKWMKNWIKKSEWKKLIKKEWKRVNERKE